MIRFTELFQRLDSTTKTNEKLRAMSDYFADVDASDAAWATYFLAGNKLRRLVPTKLLRQWAAEKANIPTWLLEESYHAVGDLAETLALIVPDGKPTGDRTLSEWIDLRLMPLRSMEEDQQRVAVTEIWRETPTEMRLVIMKLITGAFRVGVSKRLVTRAIAQQYQIPPEVISHRLMGDWKPTAEFFESLVNPEVQDTIVSQPYPFCLAHPIDNKTGPAALGDANQFVAEWKWDGIRGQVIRRAQQTFIWSRGEELMENRWPEIESAAQWLADGTVLDGEILASTTDGEVLPFAQLQRRIGRKKVGKKLLAEVPVVFHAFDLLEVRGEDLRQQPFANRRQRLEKTLAEIDHPHLRATRLICGSCWDDWAGVRETSRAHNAEGLM